MRSAGRPVLIVGCQRSGTTLVRRMCNRHPHMGVMPETHLMPLAWGQRGALSRLGRVGVASWLKAVLPRVNPVWLEKDLESRLEAVSQSFRDDALGSGDAGLADAPALFSEWLAHWRLTGQVDRAGEKTPSHIYYLPPLLRSMPGAQAIVMHRDPRAAGCSEWRKHQSIAAPGRRFTWFRFAVRWASSVRVASTLEETFGPSRVLQMRYEDVVADPCGAARSICEFLGEPYEPNMVHVEGSNTSFGSGLDGSPAGIDDRSVGRWRHELEPEAAARLEVLTAPWMASLDYDREMGGVATPPPVQLPLVRAVVSLSARHPMAFNQLASRDRYPGLRPSDFAREDA
ncbi:MAG: sulfotransferase [Gemmatimonadetes bacterium]|nr:sulfotransferase [Gemmatimonadota bacterium]